MIFDHHRSTGGGPRLARYRTERCIAAQPPKLVTPTPQPKTRLARPGRQQAPRRPQVVPQTTMGPRPPGPKRQPPARYPLYLQPWA